MQVWFLRRSRDRWKKKYQELKVDSKRLQNRVADVTKSRAKWREQAKHLAQQVDLGHACLTGILEQATDWAWLIDHSVPIGQEKCLVILGIRLPDLPPPGTCLEHADFHLVALVVGKSWTRREVAEALEQASVRTGVPRVIVSDHGGEVAGGVRDFPQPHPQTLDVYDTKHKAACLLKGRLEKNPRWQEFQKQVGQTCCALQQTELAFLVPPTPKPKARFRNLGATLHGAERILAILRQPPAVVQKQVQPERLQEKLGWLQAFAAVMAEWWEWQRGIDVAVAFVNRQGIYRGAAKALYQELQGLRVHARSRDWTKELVVFVAQQAKGVKPGERVPGSTEVLESCFGHFKQLEKQQARGGFTSLILGFGALLADTATQALQEALERSRTKAVWAWCQEHLGTTRFGQRKLAFAASATEDG